MGSDADSAKTSLVSAGKRELVLLLLLFSCSPVRLNMRVVLLLLTRQKMTRLQIYNFTKHVIFRFQCEIDHLFYILTVKDIQNAYFIRFNIRIS